MKIIYMQEDGLLAIVAVVDQRNLEEAAQQIVPEGRPFKIIEDDELPADLTYRDAWVLDVSNSDQVISIDEVKKKQIDKLKLTVLSRRQFKLILLEYGLLDQIENAISAIENDKARARIQIEYTEATEFHRNSESVAYMCNLLSLSEEQVDRMWEDAIHI